MYHSTTAPQHHSTARPRQVRARPMANTFVRPLSLVRARQLLALARCAVTAAFPCDDVMVMVRELLRTAHPSYTVACRMIRYVASLAQENRASSTKQPGRDGGPMLPSAAVLSRGR